MQQNNENPLDLADCLVQFPRTMELKMLIIKMIRKSVTMGLLSLAGMATLFNVSSADEFAGKRWPAAQQVSIDAINHEAFDGLLKKYVDEDGMVDYKSWHASAADRQALQAYLNDLSRADTRRQSKRDAQMAYWINAYNATTIEGILRVYPTTSIRNHTAKVVGYNVWKNLHLYTGNSQINLDSMEHQVLRKMNDPRIHFAIVCASIGCPRLMNEAYTEKKLEEQLVRNTTDFFSRSRNFKLNTQTKRMEMSAIMDWFKGDFGRDGNEQLRTIWPYLPKASQKEIAKGGYQFSYQPYDWNLNAQPERVAKKMTKGSGNKVMTTTNGSAKKPAAGSGQKSAVGAGGSGKK